LTDTYKLKGLRLQLVRELRNKGIEDERVLKAFEDIPRHYFLDKAFAEWAYRDVPFPIGSDQTISQPYTVAYQTELLEIKKGDRVLEIGTGSGFQACVLAHMGAKVYTIERQEKLYHKTNALLEKIGYSQVRTLFGDGYLGAPRFAPYDKILLTAGAKKVPQALFDQLAVGGVLVVPLGNDDIQVMTKYTKTADGQLVSETFDQFRFVPFLPGVQSSAEKKKNHP
jgi:protein-L-isoaspartate(D-aspartate) O-methyltransferase